MNANSIKLILLTLITLVLSACGGGGSSEPNNQNTENETPETSPEPTALSSVNWGSAKYIGTSNPMTSSVEIVGSQLIVNVSSADISQGSHLQIYMNTDNKPETGFQFENEAWEESGVDYLIEDGDLFKSTASNTGWNWNINIGAIDYTINADKATAKIDLSLLGDICNNLKIGVMTRDEFWDISTFSPVSSQMQTYTVNYCNTQINDVTGPEINLIGAQPLYLTVGDTFIDPGATAYDRIDGDVSASIVITSNNVDTSTAGIYKIFYMATDLSGNEGTFPRIVIVNEIPHQGIVVDGNSSDWNDVPTFSSSADAIMKVSDDAEKLYILVTSSNLGENTQILMDTDNNAATGLELSAQINAWVAGADYMIENNLLDKSKSNTGWSWDYGIAPIEYIKTADTLEIAVNKSDFNFLANKVPMGFVSRTIDWNVNYILPAQSLPVYIMQFANEINSVYANNDSVSTAYQQSISVDVLANDDSSAIFSSITSPPKSGTVRIVSGSILEVIYTPNVEFSGIDKFTYEVRDLEGNTDKAEVKIIVSAPTPINNPPVAVDDSFIVDIATQSSILLDVLANDSDPDGDTLTLTNVVEAPGGEYSISSDNKVLFVPSQRINEIVGIPYTISDGNGGSTTARFTVNIIDSTNANPVANDDLITTIQNQSVTFNVVENDTDADGDLITAGGISTGVNLNGTVVSNQNGSFTYTPNEGFVGLGTFSYSISDGKTGRARGTVFITVNSPIPNIPPIANDDRVTTDGIKTLRIFVESNDSDPDGTFVDLNNDYTQPANGTVSRNTPHTLDYTPNPTFSGTDTFTYSITDKKGATASATVFVTVPTNNEPDAVEDVADVFFNQTITINVLSNDTDPDGDTLSVQSIIQPTVGIATLNTDGTIYFDPQNNIGSISIAYTVSDNRGGTDIAVLTIASTDPNDGNDAYPDISNEQVSTPKNTSIFIDVLANDSDADGDVLILDQVDQGANGTTEKVTRNGVLGVLYTPNTGFTGSDIFYYGVHDGFGHNGSGFVDMTVTQ